MDGGFGRSTWSYLSPLCLTPESMFGRGSSLSSNQMRRTPIMMASYLDSTRELVRGIKVGVEALQHQELGFVIGLIANSLLYRPQI